MEQSPGLTKTVPGKSVLTFLGPAVQRRMLCFVLFCFVLSKILFSVLGVAADELHPTLQAFIFISVTNMSESTWVWDDTSLLTYFTKIRY